MKRLCVVATLVPGLAMLALAPCLRASDRCGLAAHVAELSAAGQLVRERKPYVLPGAPLHGKPYALDSCALLAFSIDAHGRARRIEVRKAWPGAVAARAGVDALEGFRFAAPADPGRRYLIGIAFEPAVRLQEVIPPGRTPP